ncbi:hypothetical protein [Parapedobacter tibetensis]|uniref:hypothetical protein n=1 Tax=Parapedobacter tibetensis TaxID=2972951 RepID=UPI00214D25B3|nr:hypothetical protein [Parapedobacter tibetensis]
MPIFNKKFIIPFGLFIAIYLPGIRAVIISPEYILMGLFILWYVFNPTKIKNALLTKSIFQFLVLNLGIILYCVLIDLYFQKGEGVDTTKLFYFKQLRFLANAIFICLGFAIVLNSLKWDVKKLLDCYVKIAIAQSIIATAMLLLPSLKDYIVNNLLDLEFLFESKEDRLLNRIYGVSSEYLFAYPLFQGFALMIIFLQIVQKNYKNVVFIPLILVSILFNARIGFIALPIVLSVYFLSIFSQKNKTSRLFRYGAILLMFVSIVSLSVILASTYIDATVLYDAVNRGLESSTTTTGHLGKLFGDMLYFPSSTIGYIFGEGRYVYQNPKDVHSDIGYVNDILFGGLIYLGFYLLNLYKLFFYKLKSADYVYRILIVSSFIMILVSNYKGPVLANNSFIRALLILVFLYILSYKERKNTLSVYKREESNLQPA